ncbi:MAG: tetratricopeptide repeat protein [Candidatus Gastranaerophilales bacterium]|nr:tetratricopeptide repeat protein [Candidatus Gastranaerophilales bacterium]
MKKIVLLMTILFVSVLTTACINNFAVQELNNKAQEYMNAGDNQKAICRLKSSLDLDNNMYETHYNLAVAYIAEKNYEDAVASLNNVLKLKPDFVDAYYSLGIAYEEEAYKLINGEDDKDVETKAASSSKKPVDAEEVCVLITKSIENYNNYLTKKIDATDGDKVNERISALNQELKKYNQQQVVPTQEQ